MEKGFYDGRDMSDPTWDACRLMKMVAELAEAFEEVKSGSQSYYRPGNAANVPYVTDAAPEGLGIELADAVIFIMDFAESKNIDLEQMIQIKMAYNKTRPIMHGKKL